MPLSREVLPGTTKLNVPDAEVERLIVAQQSLRDGTAEHPFRYGTSEIADENNFRKELAGYLAHHDNDQRSDFTRFLKLFDRKLCL